MSQPNFRRGLLGLGLIAGCVGAMDPGAEGPTNLTAGPMGGGVHLTWKDNSTGEDEFEIERKIGAAPGFARLAAVPFDTVSYHDADVSSGTSYTYRVRAKVGSGFSSYSNEATAVAGGSTGTGGGSAGTGGGSAGAGGGSAGAGGAGGSGGSAGTGGGSGGAAGTGGGAGGSTGTGGGTATVVSFRNDVMPALLATCGGNAGGCHPAAQATGRTMAQFGPCRVIWFASVDAPLGAYSDYPNNTVATGCPNLTFYERLLQQHSMLCDGATWQARAKYVVPGNLQASLLWQVINGDATFGGKCTINGMGVGRMPRVDAMINPGGRALTPAEITSIQNWILQGALNN